MNQILSCGCEVEVRSGQSWVTCPKHFESGAEEVEFNVPAKKFEAPCCGAVLPRKLGADELCPNCGAN